MTTAVLSSSRIAKNARQKAKARPIEIPQVNWIKLCGMGIALCAALLLFYIYQINVLTGKTYLMGKYEDTIKEISAANKKLEVSFAENSFLGNVTQKAQSFNLRKTTSIKYIQVSDSALAEAK